MELWIDIESDCLIHLLQIAVTFLEIFIMTFLQTATSCIVFQTNGQCYYTVICINKIYLTFL